jgi:MFS family permease
VTTASTFDRRLIAPMVLGSVLNPVNSSILAVALVPIGLALGAPAAETAWLVSGLYLATAVGQPVTGRLIDLYGPRRLYLSSSVLVGAGGLLGLLAPNLAALVAARVLIGLGTCAGLPASMYLLRREAERTGHDSPAGILTVLSVSAQTVSVVGPSLGGLLVDVGGWRATFAVNLPLALACAVLGARRLPRTAPAPRERSLAATIDLAGIVLFTTTVVTLLVFLLHPAGRWPLLAVAVGAGVALVRWELRAPAPFLDLRLIGGNRPLLATYTRALLSAVVSYALLYGYPQWLEQGRGLSPSTTGLLLLPVFAAGIAVAALTGRRPEIRGKLVVGAAAQVVLAGLLLTLGADTPLWVLVCVALVAGVPQGLANLANQNAVYHQADPQRVASSAGLLRTFFYLGAIVAATVNGAVLTPVADTAGLHELALVMLGAAGLFLLLTLADRSLARTVQH